MSTVIKDGTIVTADRTYKADVLVENGKITKIGEGLSANETLDATGCYVLPGGIDPHSRGFIKTDARAKRTCHSRRGR